MHPIVKVKQSIVNKKPQYELTLSRANFNHLCAGCPSLDGLIGYADNGKMFYIFENAYGEMANSFRLLPEGDGYFAYVGAPIPRIPQNVTNDEFTKLAQQSDENLEKAINESNKLPIEEETGFGKINLGYVVMKVEKDNSLIHSS